MCLAKWASTNTPQISLRDPENPAKYIGSTKTGKSRARHHRAATKEAGLETVTELGEAAFYGPKLDFMVKGRPQPLLAIGHHSGGLQPAGAL
jgi:threonyl-tRNA synthetase